MPKKGQTNNPAGRPPGKPNKVTSELRKLLKTAISSELENLPALLAELSPKERLDVTCKLVGYVLPKIQQVYLDEGEAELKEEGIDLSQLTDAELTIIENILKKYEGGEKNETSDNC
ncbi:MAG: hypothetical protein DRI57_10850 [Deltaproteobacteria bacterium]|nr:MAG: hypothetical protein DRI57_10850 [Deltaproteobacteria bacterium]